MTDSTYFRCSRCIIISQQSENTERRILRERIRNIGRSTSDGEIDNQIYVDGCRLQPGYPLRDEDVKYQLEMKSKVSSLLDVHKTMKEDPSKEYPDRWNNKIVPPVSRRE